MTDLNLDPNTEPTTINTDEPPESHTDPGGGSGGGTSTVEVSDGDGSQEMSPPS